MITLLDLQESLSKLPRSKNGSMLGLSAAQRQEIVELSNSIDRAQLIKTLGIGSSTLEKWRCVARKAHKKKILKAIPRKEKPKTPAFKALEVEEDSPVMEPLARRLEVTGPYGVRISGLELVEVAKLFHLMGVGHA